VLTGDTPRRGRAASAVGAVSATSAASTVSTVGGTPGEPVGAPNRRSRILGAAFGGRRLLLLCAWLALAQVLVQLSVAAHKTERLEDLLVATDVLEPLKLILGELTRHGEAGVWTNRPSLGT